MWLPRFTIRTTLIATAVAAPIFLSIAAAMRGVLWGWTPLAILAAAATSIACYATLYIVARLAANFILPDIELATPNPLRRIQGQNLVGNEADGEKGLASAAASPMRVAAESASAHEKKGDASKGATLALLLSLTLASASFARGTDEIPPHALRISTVASATPTEDYRLIIEPRSVDNYGYHPLYVTFSSAAPSTRDRRIDLLFRSTSTFGPGPSIVASSQFTLAAGETEVKTKVSLPCYRRGTVILWEISVDGQLNPELSANLGGGQARNGLSRLFSLTGNGMPLQLPEVPSLYLISSQEKNERDVTRLARALQTQFSAADATSLTLTKSLLTRHVALDQFPDDWIDYSPCDVAILDLPDLRRLSEKFPDKSAALTRWLRSGGQLWVCGVGSNWEGLESLATALPSLSDTTWYESHLPIRKEANAAEDANARPATDVKQDGTDESASTDQSAETPKGPGSGRWFQLADLGLGSVLAFRSSWRTTPEIFLLPTHRPWLVRHGLQPDMATPQFANWLIPGVGLAPINAFRLLITAFVIGIGPLNYFLLKRAHRLYLMVVTVPVSAILLTLALIAYALLSDGISARARVRSLTYLDQRVGEVATWARSSLYASLAPSEGLTLPNDVVVYPIQAVSSDELRTPGGSLERKLYWANDRQQLTTNWIDSRTPTQYMAIGARACDRRLSILVPAGKPIKVENRLECDIKQLIVIDGNGNFHIADTIAEGAVKNLEKVEKSDAFRPLLAAVNENQPAFPLGISARTASDSRELFETVITNRRRRRRGPRSADLAGIGLMDNILEKGILDLVGLAGGDSLDLPPKSYVAITDAAPDVHTGLPAAGERGSFHVTVARW